jgi:hypothetical protein
VGVALIPQAEAPAPLGIVGLERSSVKGPVPRRLLH